jgi:acyl-CoA thioesterase-1
MNKVIVLIALLFSTIGCSESAKESPVAQEENVKEIETMNDSEKAPRVILCFGNSLTAGYGLETEEAYPEVLQTALDSLGYNVKVINSGVSGETTSGGLNRIEWVMKQSVDVFILELGANDGIPTEETQQNLEAIIAIAREKSPGVEILLAGMKVPPSMGGDYGAKFEAIFPAVAEKTGATLIPFFLENVAAHPDLNQADGIHPTAEGVKLVVKNVLSELVGVLEELGD